MRYAVTPAGQPATSDVVVGWVEFSDVVTPEVLADCALVPVVHPGTSQLVRGFTLTQRSLVNTGDLERP